MTLLELLGEILDGLRGPYGVTWVVTDHSIAQTGYVFGDIMEARSIAQQGPWVAEDLDYQLDALCDHFPEDEGLTIWGNIETKDDIVSEILTTGIRSPYSGNWVSA